MQAVFFLTHIESQLIYEHFLRLKAETRGILDVYLAVHERAAEPAYMSIPADFRIPEAGIWQNIFRVRYAEKTARGGTFIPGFADLVYIPTMLGAELADYSYIWFLEYDVDFAGPWDVFFRSVMASQADLIGTTLYPKDQ